MVYRRCSIVQTRMADPPRLTTTRCQMGRSERWSTRQEEPAGKANLKTWPATPVEQSLEEPVRPALNFIGVASLQKEGAAGVGQPFENIADCQFPISDWHASQAVVTR